MGNGTASEELLKKRLDAKEPTLFYLWTPHPFQGWYNLSRIQLPGYKQDLFEKGRSDYTFEAIEKVASTALDSTVQQFLTRLNLPNSEQESMMAKTKDGRVSVFQAACEWLKANSSGWRSAWLPDEDNGTGAHHTRTCTHARTSENLVAGAWSHAHARARARTQCNSVRIDARMHSRMN